MERAIISDLISWKNNKPRKPLILQGARQVGKTYILQKFGAKYFKNVHYINLEETVQVQKIFDSDLLPNRIISELELILNDKIDIINDLLIIDEIQESPRALTALKYFYENEPNLAICTAGSLLGLHTNTSSFPVGKITFLDMYPMTFSEFLIAMDQSELNRILVETDIEKPLPIIAHEKLWELWKSYLFVGGMPEVVKIYATEEQGELVASNKVTEQHQVLIKSYMADIAKHSGKTNALHIERLWNNVVSQLNRVQDSSIAKFRFKNAIPGKRGYIEIISSLDWLEKTRLVYKVNILDTIQHPLMAYKKENWFKLTMFDMGILSAMSSLKYQTIHDYSFGSYKGYMAENFVAQELKATSLPLMSWIGKTSEIEFLLDGHSGVIPIEVKSGSRTQVKSLQTFINKYNPDLSIILSARNTKRSKNVLYLPIYATCRLAELT